MVSIQGLVSRRLRRLHEIGTLRASSTPPRSPGLTPVAAHAAHAAPAVPITADRPAKPVDAAALTGAQRLLLDYGLAPAAGLPAGLVPPQPDPRDAAPICESVANK